MRLVLRNSATALLLFFGLILLLPGAVAAEPGKYDPQMSWFIDMQRYETAAHGNLFCVQCHESVEKRSLHPDPADVRQGASTFFNNKQCGDSECHEDTLLDFEDGVHGRIQFQNRQKYANCIGCHDPHAIDVEIVKSGTAELESEYPCSQVASGESPPEECRRDAECLECHARAKTVEAAVTKETALCLHCHDQTGEYAAYSHMPLIDPVAYRQTDHAGNSCTQCHTSSATYGHLNTVTSCENCHDPHDEGEIHDPHIGVDCQACHLQGTAVADRESGKVIWQSGLRPSQPTSIHQLVSTDEDVMCVRCHSENNSVGAAAMVLPAKSVICMACHTATLSVSDPVTLITLLGMLLLLAGLLSAWMSAEAMQAWKSNPLKVLLNLSKVAGRFAFSRKILRVLEALLLDAFLQRRLFFQSPGRWFSHGLIFYPFVLRFTWGLVTLAISLVAPESAVARLLLDKNHPLVAFVFDVTGVLIVIGVAAIISRKLVTRKKRIPGLPQQEWLSLVLMGGIIVCGFLLEGMRISMTLNQPGQMYAFLGYAISLLFTNMKHASEIYGYLWYLHAILTGAFIIWLPFSRMFHIVMGPIAIAINAADRYKNHRQ